RLYRAIPPGAGGNLFLSPYSVSQAIAPLALGARGETAAQILAFLGAGGSDASPIDDPGGFHSANHELAARAMAIPDGDPTTFRIANRMWHEQTLPWEASFRDAVKQSYGAGAEPADFRGSADAERMKINAWIADNTEQKIPDLLPAGSLTANTRLVLANAIYFLGEWKDAFDPDKTKPLPFHFSAADSVETPFLVRTGSYRAADVKKTWILELPYEGDKFSMVVLLPAERDGLPALEEKLTLDTLQSWMAKLEKRKIDVFLPKFEMRTKASLEGPLAAMGLALPFDPARADFTGITTAEPLWVDRVFHEAYVRVDEKGTEAAAATATTMRTLSMPPPNPVFRADHPFLFVIRENETGLILFVGRVGNPAAGS
ncbi:MAG: serpin family protein, partial [Gemmatimonadetes bacterium]|nr:serpin family protein [Gemmatimonadota bacterium]